MALNPSHSFTTPRLLASFHQDKAPVSQLLVVVVMEVLLATQMLVLLVVLLATQLLSDCCSPAPE